MNTVRLKKDRLWVALLLIATVQSSRAQDGPSHVNLDSAKAVRINYGFPKWNSNPKKIESASMLMREGQSGRLVQIQLQETAPDSSTFSGLFSVSWKKIADVQPEFYAPPDQTLLSTPAGVQKLAGMIQRNEIQRLPFILRKTKEGGQNVEVFDTKEQARMAMKAFRAEQQAIEFQNKKILSQTDADIANMAADAAERALVAKNMADRVRLEQIEANKAQQNVRDYQALDPAEKNRRKKEAEQLAAKALEKFKAGMFPEAVELFEKVVTADPLNKSYYFQFGVALYKTDKPNRSVVFLGWAEDSMPNVDEKYYYLGLNYFKLGEFTNAKTAFKKAVQYNKVETKASSLFYIGLCDFNQKKWDDAQASFQLVMDESQDPKLDERAENYIEQILRVRQFEAEKAKKWTLSLTLGGQYDSNILSSADSALDQGTATNSSGYRALIMQGTKYRPIFEADHEWSTNLDLLYMYSVDKDFAVAQSIRNADPLLITLTLPYTRKGLLFKKGHKLDLIPGSETIYMSVEDNTNKAISQTYFLNLNNLLVMNERWFANFNMENRLEDSLLNSSTGDADADAIKVKLANSNLLFPFEEKSKIVTADVSYTVNNGKGKNVIYNRYDLGLGMIGPLFWEISWNAKLAYYNLAYTQKSDNRQDTDYALTTGLSKKLNSWLNAGLTGNYTINNSNVTANQYKKYTVMLTLSTSTSF